MHRKLFSLTPEFLSSSFTSSSITDLPECLIPVKTLISSVFINGLILCMYVSRLIIGVFYQLQSLKSSKIDILEVIVAKNGKLPNQHAFFGEVCKGVKRLFLVEAAQCDEGDACSSCEH